MLKINGLPLGLVDGFERASELRPSDGVLCELIPLDGALPLAFRFDDAFLLSPPPQITLYYTKNAVAIYAREFLPADQSMQILWQKRLKTTLVTLVLQGKLQCNLNNERGFFTAVLPYAFQNATAEEKEGEILLKTQTAFLLLSTEGEILLQAEGNVLEWENTLKAEISFRDSRKHTAICEWEHGKLLNCKIRAEHEPTETTFALALFESALIGADCAPFLSDELLEKAGSLKEYLGDFRSVVLCNEPNVVGLTYERKKRIFDVKYFTVETKDGKICNLSPLE